jgi:hypothetical protein
MLGKLGKLSGRGPTGLRPFFMPLFTGVRGTGILRSSRRNDDDDGASS